MDSSLRLVIAAVALLTVLIASQGQEQCAFPTSEDVKTVGENIYGQDLNEGQTPPTFNVTQMHFTCLVRVTQDMYAFASVVVNFTASDAPDNFRVEQYELRCAGGLWGIQTTANNFDSNLPSAPFDIETQEQCYRCEQVAASTPNYDADSNCLHCASECENNGGGFCTGSGAEDCCPVFDNSTGNCIDSCTEIDPNFGPNEDFVCVCSITCPPGHDRDLSDCSCVFVDGCEAAGGPCQNGGTCMSDLTTMPYYNCTCVSDYTDPNCSTAIPTNALPPPTSPSTAPYCGELCLDCDSEVCCRNCSDGYVAEDCECVNATTEPPTSRAPTMQPTDLCPSTCRDCDVNEPTCCIACPDGFVVRACECIEEARTLAAEQVAGIAIGIVLLVLFLLAMAVLLAYVIYYVWVNKQKMKKGTALSPFSNGESHSNPLYLTPEEVGDD